MDLSVLREQLVGDASQIAVILRLQRLQTERVLGRIESVLEQAVADRAAVDIIANGVQLGYPHRRTDRQAVAEAGRDDTRRKEEAALVLGGRKRVAELVGVAVVECVHVEEIGGTIGERAAGNVDGEAT